MEPLAASDVGPFQHRWQREVQPEAHHSQFAGSLGGTLELTLASAYAVQGWYRAVAIYKLWRSATEVLIGIAQWQLSVNTADDS